MTPLGRIVFVNRFYWPDEPATAQLLTDLAEALAARGWAVHVVASHPGTAAVPLEETRHGVAIHRIACRRLNHPGLLARARDFLAFSLSARRAVARLLQAGDTLVMMTDPPLLGTTMPSLTRARGVQLMHWIQDIYPEVPMSVAGSRIASFLRPPRDRAWSKARACVAISQEMAAFVESRGVPPETIRIIENWAPAGLTPPESATVAQVRAEWGLSGRFIVTYSGNLGRVHEIDAIASLAEALQSEPGVAFSIVGGGAQRPRLEAMVAQRKLDNVRFFAPQARNRLAASLAAGDLHLVTVREGCEALVFPSKLYGIAAVGRPVLAIAAAGSGLHRLVQQEHFGTAHTKTAVAAMVAAVKGLAGNPSECAKQGRAALEFSQRQGGLDRAAGLWAGLLSATMELAPGGRGSKLSPS